MKAVEIQSANSVFVCVNDPNNWFTLFQLDSNSGSMIGTPLKVDILCQENTSNLHYMSNLVYGSVK